MRKLTVSSYIGLILLTGCGQVDQANSHLENLDHTSAKMFDELKKSRESLEVATAQSVRLADALVSIKELGFDLSEVFKTTFVQKKTQKTSDIDSVLGAESPSEKGSK